MKHLRRLSILLLAALPCAAQVPTPGLGTNRPRNDARYNAPRFDFRSNFWLNLHHFLYQQARLRQNTSAATGSVSLAGLARGIQPAATDALPPEQQKAWREALDYYAANFANRDLLFNGDMLNIKNRLVEWEKQPDVSQSGLRAELIAALSKAAPIYRAQWWPEHDRANRAWIVAIAPRIARMGDELGVRLAAAYQSHWPAAPIGVDVTYYANWAGAYTSDDPLHVTLGSSDPRNQGDGAFEILYHEASHGLTRHVADAIARECRSRDKPIPRDLWHAVLFYTTGEMVKRALAAQSGSTTTDYVPYAYRYGLFERSWPQFRPLLERHWQQYLDGKLPFDNAISRIVNAL